MRILLAAMILSFPLVAMREPTLCGIVVDDAGRPVAGAVVVAMERVRYCVDAGPVAGRATTDASGRFDLPWAGREMTLVVRGERVIVAAAGPHVIRLRTICSARINGSRALRGSVRDEDGRPIAGANVRAAQGDGRSHRATTDASGGFVFDDLVEGHVRLVVWGHGYESACVDPPGDAQITLRRRP
jgi:carboxypeptidase family protein